MAFSFLGATYAFYKREPKESVQWKAFLGTMLGMGIGFLVYGVGLVSGLY